jgi:hypothetical protein
MCFVDEFADRDLTDTIIDAIDENTGVVAVSSVQYITGIVVDVPRIAKRVAQIGAYLIVERHKLLVLPESIRPRSAPTPSLPAATSGWAGTGV